MESADDHFFSYALPYIIGIVLLGLTEKEWITEELTIPVDGHEVAKFMMVLFVIYFHASISLGLETATLVEMLTRNDVLEVQRSLEAKIYCKKVVDYGIKFLSKFNLLKTIICSAIFAKLSIVLWKHVLWWHVCSSHDFRCDSSNAGRLAKYLKPMICGDPSERKSVMCQITMDHAPLIWFALFVMVMGYFLLPCLLVIARKIDLNEIRDKKQIRTGLKEVPKSYEQRCM